MDDRMNELLKDNQFLEIDRHFARFMHAAFRQQR